MIVASWRWVALFLAFLLFSQACLQSAQAAGTLMIRGKKPAHERCNREHDADECCKKDQCSHPPPAASRGTNAILTINGFEKGEDGGGPSACDGKYHSDNTLIVALSSRWFNSRKRCFKRIRINGNGRSVVAKVVDECDSSAGCRKDIVDASRAVWKALGVKRSQWGWMEITWSDAH
ncbi:hypothetical protein ACLOJK_040516 [Asimina triloba]